jgi:hypothetical protein
LNAALSFGDYDREWLEWVGLSQPVRPPAMTVVSTTGAVRITAANRQSRPSPEEAEQITRHFLVKLVDGDALQHRSHLPRPADPGEMVLAATVGHGVGYVAAD